MADTDKSLYNLRYNQVTSNLEAFGGGSPQWTQITLNNVDPTQVPVTRLINTTFPLQGGGNLTADRTLFMLQADAVNDGYLSHTDWTRFDTKLTSVLNAANIFVGNSSNVAVGVPLSGDAGLSNSGVLTLNTVNGNVGTFTNTQITVNAKGLITAVSSGTIGNLTDAGTDGIVVTGGIGAVLGTGTSLAQHVADTTHNGYLSSTDWNTFNGKQAAGNYITALTGDVTATGPGSVAATLATVNANVGSFGSSTSIPNFTVNGKGLITAAGSNVVIAPAGTLTGTTLAANVVSSSLTSVGTITTGVWNGTAIDVTHGGTGDSSFTAYAVITGGTTSTGPLQNVSGVGTSGQVLTSNGAAALPTWQAPTANKYIQEVQTTSNTQTSITSSTFTAATNQSVTITPTSASNRVKITATSMVAGANIISVTLKRGTTELSGLSRGFFVSDISNSNIYGFSISFTDSPATTSATTYQVFFRNDNNSTAVTCGRSDTLSVIIAEEIV